jgi:hypothetical protein
MSLKSVSPAAGYGEARQEAEKCPVNNGHRPTTQANVAVSSLAAAGTSAPTVESPQLQRRVDRRRAGAARVLTHLQRGQALHKQFTRQGPVYSLTDGRPVSSEVASLVIADVRIVSVGDGLFPTTPQTWRYAES